MPVPPSTPSNSSRNQGKGSNSTPEQENSNGQGITGMPPFAGGKGACNVQAGSGFGACGAQQGNAFQGPPGFFQSQRPQMFANVPSFPVNQVFGSQTGSCTSQVMPGMPLFQGNAQQMQSVLNLSQGLQGLQEQMRTQARLTPDTFGEVPTQSGVGANQGVLDLTFGVDGLHNELGHFSDLWC